MRKVRTYIIAFLVAMLVQPVTARAQDAAILEPILTAWSSTQLSKMAAEAKTLLDQLNNAIEQTGLAKDTKDLFQKGYLLATTVTEGYSDIKELYDECKDLYQVSVYGYNYLQRQLADGKVNLSDVRYFLSLVEEFDRRGLRCLSELSRLLSDDNGLTFEMKQSKFREYIEQIRASIKVLQAKLNQVQETIEADEEGQALADLIETSYAYSGYSGNFPIPTEKEAKKDISDINKKSTSNKSGVDITFNSDGGKQIKETNNTFNGIGKSLLPIVTMIVAGLAAIMIVPAYIRRHSGQRQSLDALYKIIVGLIVTLLAIWILGYMFFQAS